MSDLTADQITDIRRNWIRDEWKDSPDFKGISHYNLANSREFFTDDQLKAIDDYVANEYADQLQFLGLYRAQSRVDLGDDPTTATAVGTSSQRYARYKLIRAECFERMLSDPGFRATLVNEVKVLDQMAIQLKADRKFVLGRTGLMTVPLKRA